MAAREGDGESGGAYGFGLGWDEGDDCREDLRPRGVFAGFGEGLHEVGAECADGLALLGRGGVEALGALDVGLDCGHQLGRNGACGLADWEGRDGVGDMEDGGVDDGQHGEQLVLGVDALAVVLGLEREVEGVRGEEDRCDVADIADQVDELVVTKAVAVLGQEALGGLPVEFLYVVVDIAGVQLLVGCVPLRVVVHRVARERHLAAGADKQPLELAVPGRPVRTRILQHVLRRAVRVHL